MGWKTSDALRLAYTWEIRFGSYSHCLTFLIEERVVALLPHPLLFPYVDC